MKRLTTIAACLFAGVALLTHAQTGNDFVKGADVGFLTQQERQGVKFYDRQGQERECLELLKNDYQLTAIRMRVWVNPRFGMNDKNELLAMALRAKSLGMELMVDFHYADSWADPGQQPIPAAWQGHSFEEMKEDLRQHTLDVLNLLKQNGIKPRWVQVGNETANGLLWPMGHIKDNPHQYAGFIRAGYDAVKEVFPETIVLIHLDRGHNQQLYDWNLDIVKKYGGRFDMVGMSLYPYWARRDHPELQADSIITDCIRNIRHVSQKYGCDVMIVETGFEVDEAHPEVMDEGRRQLTRVVKEARTLTEGRCRGVFYWEPQCLPGLHHYNLGAFDSKGRPTAIMDGFIETPVKKNSRERQREYTPSPVAGTAWDAPENMNPIIPGYFADPTIRKFGDTYYIYATTDGTGNGYGPAQVWVSKDFVNWKNIVMNWPTTEVVWAPDVVQQPDGTFRYYYCEPCNINIGESKTPIGPWHNILGKDDAVMVPDRYIHNVITLDPQLFRDDDGSDYLYFTTWGIYKGFGCGVAKLATQPHGGGSARYWREEKPFPIAADSFFAEKRLIPNTELKDIFEAPFVFKRNGIYYFTYSSGSCHTDTYRVQYAISKVGPMGPFTYKGELLTTNEDETVHGPGHHSILEQDGRYYIVYHRHNNPKSAHGFNRQVCIDELLFDEEGNILRVVPTHNAQNVGLFKDTKHRNLAYGAKVTASSYYDEWFKPEYAVDDNNATLWKARRCNWDSEQPCTAHGEWLQIDLGKPQQFNEVWTLFEYATFFYQYKIETSLDGKSWTMYADRTNNTLQGSPMIDKGKTKARYLRITITDTQKNGHMPAIWNVKVWQNAPALPTYPLLHPRGGGNDAKSQAGYPGMHKKDVEASERDVPSSVITLNAEMLGLKSTAKPFDVTEVDCGGNSYPSMTFKANKPIRARVKDGKWGLFFNGTQQLVSEKPLPECYRYNAPYTIAVWVMNTKTGPVSTVISLSSSRADLATTEFRLGTDPSTGLINHNGSFESCGAPKEIKDGEGKWQFWTITFDGWKEKVYLNGKLLKEQNNFLMIRPDGHITIGADGSGANNFMGYINFLGIYPQSMSAEVVEFLYKSLSTEKHSSLGDDDFEEIDPDSKFTLSPSMKPVFEKKEEFTLSAKTAAFNDSPLQNGGSVCQEVEGDFVVMCRVSDMEGLNQHAVKGYNECGLLLCDGQGTYYQMGAFPLYNCGNMLTILSRQGRPQFPNYKGYDFDPILQFERRDDQLFARTSKDGKEWTNMPGSPITINSPKVAIGTYQTTYSENLSWAKLCDYIIYKKE